MFPSCSVIFCHQIWVFPFALKYNWYQKIGSEKQMVPSVCSNRFQCFSICKLRYILWKLILLLYRIYSFPVFRIEKFFALGKCLFRMFYKFVVGQLLNLSNATKICFSSFNFSLGNFPEKLIWISCPSSVSVFILRNYFSLFGILISHRTLDRLHTFFALSLMSCVMLGHQKFFASSAISFVPACP